ncbi:MAG: hypothetical protein V1869_01900 [Candidatus Omnitrophota bacterium]
MEAKPKGKWYFKTASLIAGFLLVGPFVLPLIWSNPDFSGRKKIILTAVIIILSCLLFALGAGSLKYLVDSYQQLNNMTF